MFNQDLRFARGDIWYANLIGVGSMQQNSRPVLILQNELGNKYSPTVTVVTLTSRVKNNLPTHVKLNIEDGVKNDSVALAETIMTIDKSMLISKVAKLSESKIKRIENAVMIQTGILPTKPDYNKIHNLVDELIELRVFIKKNKNTANITSIIKIFKVRYAELKDYCNIYDLNVEEVIFSRKQELLKAV